LGGLRQRQRRLHWFIANRSHRAGEYIERGVCSRLQRRAGEIETLAAKHQQKKIGMGPREGDVAASDCFQPCRGRIALANMCLHRGSKPREANCGEIAQQAHDVSEVVFRSSVGHARLTGSCA
jgi:hypothetical protein